MVKSKPKEYIAASVVVLFTGGPLGALLSPGAFMFTSKNSKTAKGKWIKWATVGLIGAPVSLGITGAMVPTDETTQAEKQTDSETATTTNENQQKQTKELENRIAELEKQLEEKEAASSQASEKAKIEPSPSPEPSPEPEPTSTIKVNKQQEEQYILQTAVVLGEYTSGGSVPLSEFEDVSNQQWLEKGKAACVKANQGTSFREQAESTFEEIKNGNFPKPAVTLGKEFAPLITAPQSLCTEYKSQTQDVIDFMEGQ